MTIIVNTNHPQNPTSFDVNVNGTVVAQNLPVPFGEQIKVELIFAEATPTDLRVVQKAAEDEARKLVEETLSEGADPDEVEANSGLVTGPIHDEPVGEVSEEVETDNPPVGALLPEAGILQEETEETSDEVEASEAEPEEADG